MSANADKTLSPEGEQFIKVAEEEGGKPKLKAYNDGTGTWTIGFGCTKGVTRGMVITIEQAQALLDTELAIHIGEVHKLITREISQGLFDALVSFFFNNGSGKCPTLIKTVNTGTDAQIRKAFMLYVNAYNEKKGKTEPWPGLVKRRQQELAHWATMDAKGDESWAPAVEPDTSMAFNMADVAKVAYGSRSLWAMVAGAFWMVWGVLTDYAHDTWQWLLWALDAVPQVKKEVDDVVSPLTEMADWVHINLTSIALTISAVCCVIFLGRHLLLRLQANS